MVPQELGVALDGTVLSVPPPLGAVVGGAAANFVAGGLVGKVPRALGAAPCGAAPTVPLPLGAAVGGAAVDGAVPQALGVVNGVALAGALVGEVPQVGGQIGGSGVGTARTGGQICGGA